VSAQDRPPTEDEMRAAYEAQLKQLRVQDLVVETLVSLVNLAGRRAGLAPGTEDERDLEQVRIAIEAVRGLLPHVQEELGPNVAQVQQAISQLQMVYAQGVQSGEVTPPPGAAGPGAAGPGATPQQPPEPPPSRLWVPGQ
jgi:hypothetical protein